MFAAMGARNEDLKLLKTDGLYVCCKCKAVIGTKGKGTESNREEKHEKQQRTDQRDNQRYQA